MRVLGLDLSLTSTGIALPDGTVKIVGTDETEPLHIRIHVLCNALVALADGNTDTADLVVMEDIPPTRAKSIAALSMIHGVLRDWLWRAEIPFVVVTPASLKKYATGRGNASKNDLLVAAVKRLAYDGSSWDEADALWLRVAGLDAYGLPVVEMPKSQRDALAKVDWPALDHPLGGVA